MARFILPPCPTGFTGSDAKLQSLCAWWMALHDLEEEGDRPGNTISDSFMDRIVLKESSVLHAIHLQPAPVTNEGVKAKARVARILMIESIAKNHRVPWREQASRVQAFTVDCLGEVVALAA